MFAVLCKMFEMFARHDMKDCTRFLTFPIFQMQTHFLKLWIVVVLLEGHSSDNDDHDLCRMGIGKYWQLTSAPTFNKLQQTNVNDDDLWPNKTTDK